MSIPVRFDCYTKEGSLIAKNVGFFTISYTDNPHSLATLAERISEGVGFIRKRYPDTKYLLPLAIPDYMIDIDDPLAVLPNKFKENV